jgi:hypothetical protein
MTAQTEFQTLIEETVSMAAAKCVPLDRLRGIALYDMSRDAPITALAYGHWAGLQNPSQLSGGDEPL